MKNSTEKAINFHWSMLKVVEISRQNVKNTWAYLTWRLAGCQVNSVGAAGVCQAP